jgi:hypothetical protein
VIYEMVLPEDALAKALRGDLSIPLEPSSNFSFINRKISELNAQPNKKKGNSYSPSTCACLPCRQPSGGQGRRRGEGAETKIINVIAKAIAWSNLVYGLPAFAECPVREDGDECEKGIRRSSRQPKNLPAYTKRFGEGRLASRSAKVDMLRRVSPKL